MSVNNTPALSIVNTISLMIVGSFILAIPLWIFFPPTGLMPETLAILNTMMGALGMGFATVINFHIGSSRSAKDAQESNRDALSTLSTSVATVAAGTGNGKIIPPVVMAAAEKAAPPAAEKAAPPAAEDAAPAAAEKAVAEAMAHKK